EAEETARRGARWLVDSYTGPQHQSLTGVIGFGVAVGESAQPVDPVARYLDGVIVYGTPDAVVDEIARLREEMFLTYLLCAPLSPCASPSRGSTRAWCPRSASACSARAPTSSCSPRARIRSRSTSASSPTRPASTSRR